MDDDFLEGKYLHKKPFLLLCSKTVRDEALPIFDANIQIIVTSEGHYPYLPIGQATPNVGLFYTDSLGIKLSRVKNFELDLNLRLAYPLDFNFIRQTWPNLTCLTMRIRMDKPYYEFEYIEGINAEIIIIRNMLVSERYTMWRSVTIFRGLAESLENTKRGFQVLCSMDLLSDKTAYRRFTFDWDSGKVIDHTLVSREVLEDHMAQQVYKTQTIVAEN